MSLTKRKTSSGGSTYWALSTLNLYSPTTYSVTVGEDSTSHDTFTVNTDGTFGNGASLNYIPAGGSGLDSYVQSLLHLSNNFTDSSSNVATYTNTGVTFTTAIAGFGTNSAVFSGTNKLTAPEISGYNIGNNDWTIDFWVYFTVAPTGETLVSQGTNIANQWDIYFTGGGSVLRWEYDSGGPVASLFYINWTPALNTAYHVVFSRSGSTGLVFINGVSQSVTLSAAFTSVQSFTGPFTIGYQTYNAFSAGGFQLQEVRFSNGIARWTSNFTPPTAPYSAPGTALPTLKFLKIGTQTAKIWTDGNNSDALTFTVGVTDYATLTSTGIATFTGQLIGKGTATNDSAATGYIGEYVTASLASGSATGLTNVTAKTVTSISLTAGDWDVTGVVDFHPDTTTTTTYLRVGISTTNNTLGAADTYSTNPFAIAVTTVDAAELTPTVRLSLTTTTTVYLIAMAGFAISTLTAYGTIRARRMR